MSSVHFMIIVLSANYPSMKGSFSLPITREKNLILPEILDLRENGGVYFALGTLGYFYFFSFYNLIFILYWGIVDL